MIYLFFILSYLCGSISFAIITSKLMHLKDPRTYGSENAGATNVMRSGNKKAAIMTLLGDFLKGFIVIILAKVYLGHNMPMESIIGLCGIFVILGHIYPIFFRFKGGKGVATALGVIAGLNLLLALLVLVTWLIVFKISKVSSLSALVGSILAPVYAYFIFGNSYYFGATLIISVLLLYKHKGNIMRLMQGSEHKFGENSK